MEALVAAIGKTENIAIIVLLLACGGLGWMLVSQQRAAREDMRKALDAFAAIKDSINETKIAFIQAMSDLKVAIASLRIDK